MISDYILALIPAVLIAWVILAFTRKRTPAFASGFLLAIGGLFSIWFLSNTIEMAAIGKVQLRTVTVSVSTHPYAFPFHVLLHITCSIVAIAFCGYNLVRVLRGKEIWWGRRRQK